jgi:hypothetical protein
MLRLALFPLLLFSLSAPAEENANPQWSLCDPAESVAARLGAYDAPKQSTITYFESLPVRYLDRGLTFRIKEGKKKAKSSIKMRTTSVAGSGDDHCEWDRYGATRAYTCEVDNDDPEEGDPWNEKQRSFAEKFLKIGWGELHAFGPYPDRAWKAEVAGYDGELDTVDLPNGLAPLVELSVKIPLSRENATYEEVTAELKRLGVSLCDRQESKTLRLFRELGLK